jgi:hypothetical protein
MTRLPPLGTAARLTVTAAVACALYAAPASAGTVTFGSDLSASTSANLAETHGADSAFWLTALGNSGTVRVPADGQIAIIKLKGIAQSSGIAPPRNDVRFQTLRPQADGSVTAILTSQTFYVPVGGDPNQVSTYHPENLCAKAGDYIAFNNVGGFDPSGGYANGVAFQVFGGVTGSVTKHYTKDEGTKNGHNFPTSATRTLREKELLMQTVLLSGNDASWPCGGQRPSGWGQQPAGKPGAQPFRGLNLPGQTIFLKKGVARVRVSCPREAKGPCGGALALSTRGRVPVGSGRVVRKRLRLGRARFSKIAPGRSRRVAVKISRQGIRLIKRRRGIKAFATAATRAGSSAAKTTRRVVTLKPAKRHRR